MIKLTICLAFLVFCSSFHHGLAIIRLDEGTTDCYCPISVNIFYLCGSNGSTYSNHSALRCAEICTNKKITIAYEGQCRE